MSKHTPGPWTTDEADHDEPYQDIRIQAGKRGICRVWIDDAPVHDYNAEQRANARLIAAAPDLLEALKALLNAESGYEWGGYSEEEIAARDKAFAAIKAAEEGK